MLCFSVFAVTPSCRPTQDGRELTLDEIARLYLPPEQRDIDYSKKGQTGGGADKYSGGHNYLGFYQRELADRPPTSKLLELGINRGDSLIMWATHFCAGEVFGVGALHHAPTTHILEHLRHARRSTPATSAEHLRQRPCLAHLRQNTGLPAHPAHHRPGCVPLTLVAVAHAQTSYPCRGRRMPRASRRACRRQ